MEILERLETFGYAIEEDIIPQGECDKLGEVPSRYYLISYI